MNSFFQLGLDTTPPQNIQMLSTDNVNFPYSDSAEITISADEPLGVFNSEIYIIDSKGNRFDVQMSPVSGKLHTIQNVMRLAQGVACLLYTSDAADEEDSVDLGGRRIIKKK